MLNAFSRVDDSLLSRWYWTVDRVIMGTVAILMLLGVMLVASGSPSVAERIGLCHYYFLTRHVIILIPCIGIGLALSMIPRHTIWRLCSIGLFAAIAGLVLVLFSGDAVKGATRWISLFGQSLQPSEFVKPFFAVVSAWLLTKESLKESGKGLLSVAILYTVIIFLLLSQPDLGTSVQISLVMATQFVLLGMPLRLAGLIGAAGGAGIFGAYVTLPHVHSRIDRFLDPSSGDNYQITKSLESFSNGGLIGVGPGQGIVKQTLPDVHSDFILSVAGEEMGAVFVWFIFALFVLLLWQGYRRLEKSNDMFSIIAGGGLLAILGVQAAIHSASALHLIPTKGMTLPFISYGGSAILSASISAGMILAFTRHRGQSGISKGSLSPTGYKKDKGGT